MDGLEYRTSPSRRIRADHRLIVEHVLRTRHLDGDHYPDGRAWIHQPIRLIRAISVVRSYFAEQEPKA